MVIPDFVLIVLCIVMVCWILRDIDKQQNKTYSYRNKLGMKIDLSADSIGYDFSDEKTRKVHADQIKKTIDRMRRHRGSKEIRKKERTPKDRHLG